MAMATRSKARKKKSQEHDDKVVCEGEKNQMMAMWKAPLGKILASPSLLKTQTALDPSVKYPERVTADLCVA